MNARDPIPFRFENHDIRVVHIDGEPHFVGKDVADALGYVDATTANRSHCKGVQKLHPLMTGGGMQQVRVLAEADVLRLIVSSTLPSAEAFERWVFEEVLPSIRKTGSYTVPAAASLPALPPEHQAIVALLYENAAIKAEQAALAQAQLEQAEAIKRIEANQIAAVASVQSFTALGYSLYRDLQLSKIELSKLGKRASAISKKRGITVDQVSDGRYGRVGSYHISVLDAALEDLCK